MQVVYTTFLPIFKYVYLIVFFTLLAAFFHPIIKQTSFDSNVFGVFTLFIGLAGCVLLVKATTSKYPPVFLGLGFGLISLSLYFIFLLSGRV